jgi:hypothetical protein
LQFLKTNFKKIITNIDKTTNQINFFEYVPIKNWVILKRVLILLKIQIKKKYFFVDNRDY